MMASSVVAKGLYRRGKCARGCAWGGMKWGGRIGVHGTSTRTAVDEEVIVRVVVGRAVVLSIFGGEILTIASQMLDEYDSAT